ncbi:MAG: hypothetical protein HQL52_06665 [Magnetococcales bacterium]|nr:hypothetical protein [Magnetococcales bacterium]
MNLKDYLAQLDDQPADPQQQAWYAQLEAKVTQGRGLFESSSPQQQALYHTLFNQWVRTEELKAWYGEPERGALFQGTSVSSLTIPHEMERPLDLDGGIEALEESLAESYIQHHDRHQEAVIRANLEPVDKWIGEGIFFGVALGAKMITQAFDLTVPAEAVLFDVNGVEVDPHQITAQPMEIRQAYFEACRERVEAFGELELTRTDLEKSLVLGDISKPRIDRYRGRLMLGPVRCNEIATLISRRLVTRIREKTQGRIHPRSLLVMIYDTDTPYSYHQVAGYFGHPQAPVLPGLTLLGSSGSCDAFRWLYIYRCGLISQKIVKGSLYSEVERRFMPFVFFGVLVERDAEILLDLDRLSLLRYRGDISPWLEFCYLLPKLHKQLTETVPLNLHRELTDRLR